MSRIFEHAQDEKQKELEFSEKERDLLNQKYVNISVLKEYKDIMEVSERNKRALNGFYSDLSDRSNLGYYGE